MRRVLRAAVTWTAAAVVIAALSGASLSVPAVAIHPAVHKRTLVLPPYHSESPVRSDAQQIAAALPARQQAAAAAAAALAAAQAAAAAAAAAAAEAAEAAARAYTVNVWTYGFQNEVNACRGGVDMTANYGMRIVGEHWSCGGSSFPTTPGTVVRFTGIDAGTYRVIGVVATLDAYTAHTWQVPHNYEMLYQTCSGGDSTYTEFIGLTQIG
jgi:hypothetical protein